MSQSLVNPPEQANQPQSDSRHLCREGERLFKEGRVPEAVVAFRQALEPGETHELCNNLAAA